MSGSLFPTVYAVDVAGTVTILGVCGVSIVSGSPITYGVFGPNIESTDQTLRITNEGNIPGIINVKGTDWNGVPSPTGVMAVGATHYTTISGTAYNSKSALTTTDEPLTTLSPSEQQDSFWQLKTVLEPDHSSFIGEATQTVTLTASC